VHRDAVEKLLEEQGLFEVSIPAQDAKLSDYTADAGYSVLPAEIGWSASKEDILNAVVEALQSDQSELDLTDTFAVQPAVTADNATLAEKAAADGVPVMLSIYPGMPHDFALLLPEMEESIQSIREIADFVNRCMN